MSNIVITGITGKSGMFFLNRLSGDTIFCANNTFTFILHSARSSTMMEGMNIPNACIIGDLTDTNFLDNLFLEHQYDVLLHIAGTRLTPNLAEAAIQHGIKRLILVHTTGIYSKYKRAAQGYIEKEKELKHLLVGKDISITILRPTMIYGNLNDKNVSRFIKMVDKMKIFPVVAGAKFALQPVHAKDLGEAYYSVLTHPEETANKDYNLSGGAPIMLIDMLKVIARYLGKENKFVSVPFWLAYAGAWLLWLTSFGKIDYREKVQRLVEPRAFSHMEASRDFGYAPETFQVGVKEEVEMYLQSTREKTT